jgi:SOS-response transcriptional repressor LexA
MLNVAMTAAGAFSWNSELPSGRNPFWLRDEALAGLGLHTGDAVSVDTRAEPREGDLVVVEVEVDGDSLRTARRYFALGDQLRLEGVGEGVETLEVPALNAIVMGVVAARLNFPPDGGDPIEEPLRPPS